MSKITAKIIADSLSPNGSRCTTFILTFPRIILSEFNTHRMISKNSASSRAIPFKKMMELVSSDPFIPLGFQKTHSGMQGTEYFTGEDHNKCIELWLKSRDFAVENAIAMDQMGITKQLVNRTIEPWMNHTVIATGTDWENYFALRFNDQAEIHIQKLAEVMLEEYNKSIPKRLMNGEWHIPFGDTFDHDRLMLLNPMNSMEHQMNKVKIATARCARVSYLNFEGKDDYEADLKLHDVLKSSGHFSPFEHCATATGENEYYGNFSGFLQYRKRIPHENKRDQRVLMNTIHQNKPAVPVMEGSSLLGLGFR